MWQPCGSLMAAWWKPDGGSRYSPTAAAACSRKREPSRLERQALGMLLWPVWGMIARAPTMAVRLTISATGAGQRLTHALILSALAESPEAVMAAIRALRAEFVATDPLLASLR